MVGRLLLRGMLAGILAGLLCFAFLKVAGEPSVERAIAFESAMDEAKAPEAKTPEIKAPRAMTHDHGAAAPVAQDEAAHDDHEPELVSRPVQAGIGLFTGVAVYNAAFGGLFALAFALAYGRMGRLGPRATAVVLAAAGFVALSVVPGLKYPANPPSVGDPATIGMRTAWYFALIAFSLAGAIAAALLQRRLLARFGGWNATLIVGAVYLVAMVAVACAMPVVNEVPEAFPATVLWQFRVAAWGAQLIMWTTLGLGFGVLAERVLSPRAVTRLRPALS